MTALKSVSDSRSPAPRVVTAWLVMTLVAVLLSLALGERMRRGVFDSWQALSPRDLSQTDVRVVMIDNPSIEMVGAWPWPRYYLARLTEELAARGAKVIAFDILFSEHDRVQPETFVSLYPELGEAAANEVRSLESMDELFGKVVGSAPVVLGHAGVAAAPANQPAIIAAPIHGDLPRSVDQWPAELAAIPELEAVALGHGLVNGRPDDDGVVRSVPMVMRAGGKPRPGFALEIARNVANVETIAVAGTNVRLGKRSVPIDRHGRMHLHFGRFPSDKIVSAAEVLGKARRLKQDTFAGSPVIIGMSADGTSDIAATPLAAEEYGPLVQAQAVDAVLTGGWLDRPGWAAPAEWAAAALLALLALGNARFGRGYRILLALVFAAVPISSWLAFSSGALLIDPARPLLVGGGALAGVAAGLFAVARAERERLREALVREQVAAAEALGELQAARAIQLGMVPPRERLRSLDPRIDLDALLEPARSVGGDFYDVIKIGDDQLAFAIADVTGKGVPAALFMAMSKALTSAALWQQQSQPPAMAEVINSGLLKDNCEAMSVTMLIGILDLRTGETRMACAGHEDPYILSVDGQETRIRLQGGPPLSIVDFPYPSEPTLTVKPGETLVLVTDGVTEAQNAGGELFGRDTIIRGGGKSDSASSLIERICDDVRKFENGVEATDDLAVMAIRFLGVPSGR